MTWENGRLKYTPAVEQLEFAFESVPRSEPWFETFDRQDRDQLLVKNVPQYFSLYSKSPKLPYEIGQLPPLKPNCCPLSALVRAAPARRAGGTRAGRGGRRPGPAPRRPPARPRKSPREHASTRAMLSRAPDDDKSTASEDTSEPPAPAAAAPGDAAERLRRFLADVFEEAEDELWEGPTEGEALASAPDVPGLVADCDRADPIRRELQAAAAPRRRAKFKKKNKTGWPSKRRPKKDSRANSSESDRKAGEEAGSGPSSVADDSPGAEESAGERKSSEGSAEVESAEVESEEERGAESVCSARSALAGLLLQPVVRVARVDHPPRPRARARARPRLRR